MPNKPVFTLIKHFLHLTPEALVTMRSFQSEHTLNRVWPEVLLCTCPEQAKQLAAELNRVYVKHHEAGNVVQFSPYVVYGYTDKRFYELAHRVPYSLKRLQSLHEVTQCVRFDIEPL